MNALLGTSPGVFFGVTVVLVGFAAYMTGQALGSSWKPYWQLVVACVLLGVAARFLSFALFAGSLFSVTGYLAGVAVLLVIGSFAFRMNRARKMVRQYPWLYRRAGLFGWRQIGSD